MISVRRPTVTIAMQGFAEHGIIETSRGHARVLDRQALMNITGKLYGLAEAEYARLLDKPRQSAEAI